MTRARRSQGFLVRFNTIEDLFSRTLVANEVRALESSELAAALPGCACLREGIGGRPLALHSGKAAR